MHINESLKKKRESRHIMSRFAHNSGTSSLWSEQLENAGTDSVDS